MPTSLTVISHEGHTSFDWEIVSEAGKQILVSHLTLVEGLACERNQLGQGQGNRIGGLMMQRSRVFSMVTCE